jgi:hypothetical protein
MATYKRPLPAGVECEDQRLAHNPSLGQGAVAVAEKPVKKPEPQVVEAPKETKAKTKVEAPVEVETELEAE